MRIARVLGCVVLSRAHPSLLGARLRLAAPLSWEQAVGGEPTDAEEFVAWDEFGAGAGSLIAVADGAEAAQPFRTTDKPIDAYVAALLDRIEASR